MEFAYVLIETEASKEHEVYDKLKKYPHITKLDPIFGDYNLIAKVEDESYDEIINYIEKYIRQMPEVNNIKSLFGRKFS